MVCQVILVRFSEPDRPDRPGRRLIIRKLRIMGPWLQWAKDSITVIDEDLFID
jgi:hypothetical protein